MKIVAVSDHFVRTEHYEECFAKYPEYELKTIFFGTEDRFEMRDIFHKIERNGPDAYPIPEELYTPMFAVARIAGWSAHRMEELINCNKIIRPAYKSVAPNTEYIPMDKR